jgi:ribosomal protein L11
VGKVTKKQLEEIAKLKEKDLNAKDIDRAVSESLPVRPAAWAVEVV